MSPHYTSVRDGNTTTIPENYRPKHYKPNAFYVRQPLDQKENEQSDGGTRLPETKKDEPMSTSIVKEINEPNNVI